MTAMAGFAGLCFKKLESLTVRVCVVFLIWNVIEPDVPVCDTGNRQGLVFHSNASRPRTKGLLASAQGLPDFTTEEGLFTGMDTGPAVTPAPLKQFDVSVMRIYGTFVNLNISWFTPINVTKVVLKFVNDGQIIHNLEIPIDLAVNLTKNVFPEDSNRVGFAYRLGGLTKQRRFYLQCWGYVDGSSQPFYDKASFLTGELDTDDKIYNLNGIFMVLGISTILMVVVMVCVGYEKLLHQKKKGCMDVLCCRTNTKKSNKINSGSISPEPLTGRRDTGRRDAGRGMPALEDEFARSGPSRAFGF